MLRIRLTRVGLKKQPSYRIVVMDKRKARDSRYHEAVGFYNPRTQPETVTIQEDRVLYWLSVGAQPSEAVERMLRKLGTLDRFARLRAGEDMDALVAEAEAQFEAAEPISPQTRFPAPEKSAKKTEDAVTAAVESAESEDGAEEAAAEESADEAVDAAADASAEDAVDDETEAAE